ncbi:MAG: cupin domain-containing protein [Legionella sp.]|nr:cupin domain-containing protein [Legionella sp.]
MGYNSIEAEQITLQDSSEVMVIRRCDIPSIHSVMVDGVSHNLGILKNFKINPTLAQFIPKLATLSLSWVSLQKDEILDTHEHPIESMVIVTSGEVKLVGDKEDILRSGDLVTIPRGCKHGFIGSGENGFWGLSLQFEQRGLYEKIDIPLVEFINESKNNIDKY